MARLTKWDAVRGCYVIVPDSTQNHIQRLGMYEDRDEAKKVVCGEELFVMICPICKGTLKGSDNFCSECGQRLKWSENE